MIKPGLCIGKNKNNEIGEWYNITYTLRNKVAHAGYHPNKNETLEAINSAMTLRLYIISLKRPIGVWVGLFLFLIILSSQ